MAIVGFSFTKVLAERKGDGKEKININNNVSIIDVAETTLPVGVQTQDALKINFLFTTSYDPNFGAIELNGNLMYIGDPKEMKDIFANWNKTKKLNAETMKQVLNTVLGKCNIQALIMSRDVQLPPPVPLPRVNVR